MKSNVNSLRKLHNERRALATQIWALERARDRLKAGTPELIVALLEVPPFWRRDHGQFLSSRYYRKTRLKEIRQAVEILTGWVSSSLGTSGAGGSIPSYKKWLVRTHPECWRLCAESSEQNRRAIEAQINWVTWMIGEINREIDQLEACSADALGSWSRTRTTAPDRSS